MQEIGKTTGLQPLRYLLFEKKSTIIMLIIIFMIFKIIASIFNKIRFISLYSKLAKFVRTF